MTLQEIIDSFEKLSQDEQISLLNFLLFKRKRREISVADKPAIVTELENLREENFWQMTLRFREQMQKEGIEFTDSYQQNQRKDIFFSLIPLSLRPRG